MPGTGGRPLPEADRAPTWHQRPTARQPGPEAPEAGQRQPEPAAPAAEAGCVGRVAAAMGQGRRHLVSSEYTEDQLLRFSGPMGPFPRRPSREGGRRFFAVWDIPDTSGDFVGIHAGRAAWRGVESVIPGGLYRTTEDRLCGSDSWEEVVDLYFSESNADVAVVFWWY